jgi:hypothetical protein
VRLLRRILEHGARGVGTAALEEQPAEGDERLACRDAGVAAYERRGYVAEQPLRRRMLPRADHVGRPLSAGEVPQDVGRWRPCDVRRRALGAIRGTRLTDE